MFHLTEEDRKVRLRILGHLEDDDLKRIEEEVDAVIGNRDPGEISLLAEISSVEGLLPEMIQGLVPTIRKKGIKEITLEN